MGKALLGRIDAYDKAFSAEYAIYKLPLFGIYTGVTNPFAAN